jgi:hypothetical protein
MTPAELRPAPPVETIEQPDPVSSALSELTRATPGLVHVRTVSWMHGNGSGSPTSALWIVGELDPQLRNKAPWTNGGSAEVTLRPLGGGTPLSRKVDLSNTVGDFMRVTVPGEPTPLGEPVLSRRSNSPGQQSMRTADLRFRKTEVVRFELPTTSGEPVSARLLDTRGSALGVPTHVSDRPDSSDAFRWIVVDVPMSEARRDRVEREVFARLDAMRDVDHANEIAPVRRASRRLPIFAAGFAFVAAAASVVFLVSREAPPARPSSPSLVVTPAGVSSRFTVGDAVIDAGSDTSVEVKQDANGTTTLTLASGRVECEVMPRPNRAPVRVIAGDVTVEVVGTRFEVSRLGEVTRVDVARGKVKVHGNGEQRYVSAGQSWTSALAGSAVAVAPPVVTLPAEPD